MILYDWVAEVIKKPKFNLLWKGSRDGYSAKEFHSRCDKKGPTLTVVLPQTGYIIGGFTMKNWDGEGEKEDKKAFIYSLTRRIKFLSKGEGKEIYVSQERYSNWRRTRFAHPI